MRLGELRTVTRDMENKLIVKAASYDSVKGVQIFDVDFDMSNDNELYLRIIGKGEDGMTIKQCNTCKYFIYVKELGERCGRHTDNFMKNKDCELYEYGDVNQAHKEFFEKVGEEYPFTEIR